MTNEQWLSRALATIHTGAWYGWRKIDDNGNKIPNNQRMTYENIIILDDTKSKPTEEQVNAKIQELKDAETARETKKASGKQKLKDLGLDDDEIKALTGV